MAQQTLEEVALNFAITIQTKEGTVSRLNAIEWFKAGAKWQEQQGNKCYHPLHYRLAKSDINFECTLCGKFM
jgi:hypothetical protein